MTFARESSSWISEFTRRGLINRQPNIDVDAPVNVRFRTIADIAGFWPAMVCPLMTQSGHLVGSCDTMTSSGSIGCEMTVPSPIVSVPDPHAPRRLSPNVAALGYVSMLTAMSSAMIYSLLPVFMVRILGISIASVGLIEGTAEAANP